MLIKACAICLAAFLLHAARGQSIDSATHTVQFVSVENDVRLEVLDWGGSGRPVVLLAGAGDTAHAFDDFAPKLTRTYHVYGITRRGFGRSSSPESGYSADRLGDDVLAVLDALKLNRPVLVGHSVAGEELSSIGSRHPERVAGLVYLEAAYIYAYYDPSGEAPWRIDLPELERRITQLQFGRGPQDARPLMQEVLTMLPLVEKDLQELQKSIEKTPELFAAPRTPPPAAAQAIIAGYQKYTQIPVPVLAIFAVQDQSSFGPEDEAQARAFEKGVPSARVVRLPHASHYVYRSNEADVVREINSFIVGLP